MSTPEYQMIQKRWNTHCLTRLFCMHCSINYTNAILTSFLDYCHLFVSIFKFPKVPQKKLSAVHFHVF